MSGAMQLCKHNKPARCSASGSSGSAGVRPRLVGALAGLLLLTSMLVLQQPLIKKAAGQSYACVAPVHSAADFARAERISHVRTLLVARPPLLRRSQSRMPHQVARP